MDVLRPYGIVIDGKLELGLELAYESGWQIRPHTGIPGPFVVSPPFFNAHSHFEYRGFQGKLSNMDYWPWIRELTRLKPSQTPDQVALDCLIAARDNLATGITRVWEHSDRPGSLDAIEGEGLSGRVYFELITFFERNAPHAKRDAVLAKLEADPSGTELGIAPHATYTVDEDTLRWAAGLGRPISIHLSETPAEREFFEFGKGPIADFYSSYGARFEARGFSPTKYLECCGILGTDTQLVHCCDVNDEDIEAIARSGSSVAHCPRSNVALGCPPAPVRRLLESGIDVRIGLDSAASSGPIDMFDEIRSCVDVSLARGEPVSAETAWKMASAADEGEVSADGKVLIIEVPGALTTDDLLERASPQACRLVELKVL